MDLRHMRYALAVAQELNFTRAAERLGIGQPPLSQQIKQMEDELGTRLFLRKTRSVTVTEAGRVFLEKAEKVVHDAEQAVLAAKRAALGQMGRVRIGFTGSASFNAWVPRIINCFRNQYPDVELHLTEQATGTLLANLQADEIDVAFLRPTFQERQKLALLPMPGEALWIALPRRHHLATKTEIDLIELAAEQFVFYPRANGSLLYDTMTAVCRNAGFSPHIVQEAPQMASMVNLVAAGVGIALVPESMCRLHPNGIAYVRLMHAESLVALWLARRNTGSVSILVQNFMKSAQETLLSGDCDTISE